MFTLQQFLLKKFYWHIIPEFYAFWYVFEWFNCVRRSCAALGIVLFHLNLHGGRKPLQTSISSWKSVGTGCTVYRESLSMSVYCRVCIRGKWSVSGPVCASSCMCIQLVPCIAHCSLPCASYSRHKSVLLFLCCESRLNLIRLGTTRSKFS